jgi:hypothetical protein
LSDHLQYAPQPRAIAEKIFQGRANAPLLENAPHQAESSREDREKLSPLPQNLRRAFPN